MRVAVDMRSIAETGGRISGVENYFVNIFNRLRPDAGDAIIPIINRFKPARFPRELRQFSDAVQTRMPNKILNASLALTGLPRFEWLYGDFDVLWMPDIRPFSIAKKTKLVATVHDLSPLMHPEFYSMRRRIWHHVADYGKAIRRADRVLAVSEYTKGDIAQRFGVDPEKISVVYPGVDVAMFKPLAELDAQRVADVRRRHNLSERYILALSTIEPRKNIEGLIAGFEAADLGDIQLVIAGRLGWLYKPVLERIAASPKSSRITLLGYVGEEDKPALIAAAQALCYPSYYEGFGFQPLEAMACGVPVVASARTSVPEICGGAALLAEPYHREDIAAGLVAVTEDQALRSSLIAKGLIRARQFSWDDTAAGVYKALKFQI